MAEVQWFEDHVVDEDGRRFALSCGWSPETVGLEIPSYLILTEETRRAAWGEQKPKHVTAAVTPPRREGEALCRVFLQDELPTFGAGWHTLSVKIGKKWVRLEDARGRVRKIELHQFNLLGVEFINDHPVEGPVEPVGAAPPSDASPV